MACTTRSGRSFGAEEGEVAAGATATATERPPPEPTPRRTPDPGATECVNGGGRWSAAKEKCTFSTPAPTPAPTPPPTPQPTRQPTAVPTPVPTPTRVISVAAQNAARMASDYLDYTAFSRQGLIDQLVFEGFAADVAAAAVDSLSVDWFEQAANRPRATSTTRRSRARG